MRDENMTPEEFEKAFAAGTQVDVSGVGRVILAFPGATRTMSCSIAGMASGREIPKSSRSIAPGTTAPSGTFSGVA